MPAITQDKNTPERHMYAGDLRLGEYHPAAESAMRWIRERGSHDLMMWQEAFASCAISGNRCAELCSETLRRLMAGEPVSDRYLLGLAWAMRDGEIQPSKSRSKRVAIQRGAK